MFLSSERKSITHVLSFTLVALLLTTALLPARVSYAQEVTVGGLKFKPDAFADTLISSHGEFTTSGPSLAQVVTGSNPNDFAFSRTPGAYVEVGFSKTTVVNGPGNDLAIFELGIPDKIFLRLTVQGVSRLYQTVDTGHSAGGFNLNVATINLDDFGLASGATLKSVVVGLDFELPGGTVPSITVIGALNTGCGQLTVPLLKQHAQSWGSLNYDHYYSTVSADNDGDGKVDEDPRDGVNNDQDQKVDEDTPDTIGKWGCYLTAGAMIIKFHAAQQGSAFDTDPASLNEWLKGQPDGYVGSLVNPSAVARYARSNGVQLFYHGKAGGGDNGTLDNFLCNNDPVILDVGGHFVLATGKTTVEGVETYSINDPGHQRSTLLPYGNRFLGIRKFSSSATPPTGLRISGHSPIQLLVTDPQGRRTGINPSSHEELNEIPDASYGSESLSVDDDSDTTPITAEIFEVLHPTDGTYEVTVVGTGIGTYRLNFIGYDQFGNPTVQTIFGVTNEGVTTKYRVSYSVTAGVQATGVVHVVSGNDILGAVRISRQLGLIDNQGLANSLAQKLEAANAAKGRGQTQVAMNLLRAFINEVSGQSGKHITTDVANMLIADANTLVQ